MIEPLNHGHEDELDFAFTWGDWSDLLAQLADKDENEVVTMHWRNVTLMARAGTVRGWAINALEVPR